jgi:hypothetical protein
LKLPRAYGGMPTASSLERALGPHLVGARAGLPSEGGMESRSRSLDHSSRPPLRQRLSCYELAFWSQYKFTVRRGLSSRPAPPRCKSCGSSRSRRIVLGGHGRGSCPSFSFWAGSRIAHLNLSLGQDDKLYGGIATPTLGSLGGILGSHLLGLGACGQFNITRRPWPCSCW